MLVENPRDIDNCKQLLPFPGRSIEVVTVEKRQQNDFSVVSESQPSTLENDETSEVSTIRICTWSTVYIMRVFYQLVDFENNFSTC